MPNATPSALRKYAIERFTDGAPHLLIMDELINDFGASPDDASEAMGHARTIIARDFDEADYGFIKACAFAGDSYRQRLYRDRIQELLEDQRILREETGGGAGIDERAMNLILAIDRSIQQYANLSHRGRRDLPVAFAPKGVLQDTAPPEDEDIEAAIDGAL